MSSLSERLRLETRSAHEQTEQLFYSENLRSGTLSLAEYIHLLHTHFRFHQALETAIALHANFFDSYQPERRKKTGWLVADLHFLGEPLPSPRPGLFADWSAVALLGAAYVAEGSMLGATVIGRMLQQNPSLQPLIGPARFYEGYGTETGSYWRAFGAFLMQNGTPHADEVVDAASRAFMLYQTVFRNSVKGNSGEVAETDTTSPLFPFTVARAEKL